MAFVDKTVEVRADIRRVYELWTVFEDYPKFMDVVEHVHLFEEGRMRWAAFFDEDVVEWDETLSSTSPRNASRGMPPTVARRARCASRRSTLTELGCTTSSSTTPPLGRAKPTPCVTG